MARRDTLIILIEFQKMEQAINLNLINSWYSYQLMFQISFKSLKHLLACSIRHFVRAGERKRCLLLFSIQVTKLCCFPHWVWVCQYEARPSLTTHRMRKASFSQHVSIKNFRNKERIISNFEQIL